MKVPISASSFLCAAFCLADCGGRNTGPTSTAGVTLVSAVPPPGSTITLMPHSNGQLSAPISMTFTVVSDQDIFTPVAVVEWGRCALATKALPDELKPNQPQTLMVDTAIWGADALLGSTAFTLQDCPLPTNTSTIRVTVVCLLCPRDNPRSFSREVPSLSYTFVAWTPPGSQYPVCGFKGSGPCVDGGGNNTGMCEDGASTCSRDLSAACRLNGGLFCIGCPGPLCPFPLPPP